MPFWQESDTFHDDPRWAVLAEGHSVTVDQLQAGYARLMSIAARHMTSGWLTKDSAAGQCRPLTLTRLATRVLPDMPPFLHTPGDECDCITDGWLSGYAYKIHWFLKRNPAKRETERYRAQKREREDPRVRAQLYERDAGCCRYCRSGPMRKKGMGNARDRRVVINYDHVDPDQLAGPELENLVVSCDRCNKEKGARTPYEADMELLPAPTEEERREWLARDECARFDRPPTTTRQRPDNAETALSTALSTSMSGDVPDVVPGVVDDPRTGAETPDEAQRQPAPLSTEVAGSGRGGPPGVVEGVDEVGQPARSPTEPDIYSGRSRGPQGGDS